VRALTPNPSGELIPGAFAELTINLRQIPDALMIPTYCLVPLLNSQNVFVISNGRAQLIKIETGIRKERLIQVVSGLQEGDTIATSALLALKENMPVTVKSSETHNTTGE
jgi:membrane fusion protein (multidrug efflux system)